MKGREMEDKFNIFDMREKDDESEVSFELDKKKKKMQESSINLRSDDSSNYVPNKTQ